MITLKLPCLITPRLMAGIRVSGAFISVKYAGEDDRGAQRFFWAVDVPALGEFTGNDLAGWHGLQGALESLCSFLSAAGESYRYAGMEGENSDLFPEKLVEWAYLNSDELVLMTLELSETPNLIEE